MKIGFAFRALAGLFCSLSLISFIHGAELNDPLSRQGPHSYRRGPWFIVETTDFEVFGRDLKQAKEAAEHCDVIRERLQKRWIGGVAQQEWSPKCKIVIHSNLAGYMLAAGRGAEKTVGVSQIERRGNSILRRIDVRGDKRDWATAALPHEMTHVVLADRFADRAIPRWTDEGMAILADTQIKQSLHARDLREGFARRTTYPLYELATLSSYPAADRWGVFYGQSASVVRFLTKRAGSEQFVRFVELAMEAGYDKALQNVYGIDDIGELDRLWRSSELRNRSSDS